MLLCKRELETFFNLILRLAGHFLFHECILAMIGFASLWLFSLF